LHPQISSSVAGNGGQVINHPLTGVPDHLPPSHTESVDSNFKLRPGCEFYPYDGGQGKAEFIIRTPGGRQYKISSLSKEILQQLDGEKSLAEVSEELQGRSINITAEELYQFLNQQYGQLRIFERSDITSGETSDPKKRASLPLLLHWALIPGKQVAWLAARFQFLYRMAAVMPGLILIVLTHYLVYFQPHSATHPSNAGSLWVLLLSLASVLCHEFGHAAAVSKYGGSPGTIGFGLYLLLPTFYADVSEVWRFRRRQRMVVDVGGVYFQQLCFVVFALLNYYTGRPEYLVACYFIDLMAWFNLNPIFRFDGYWLLVDYLALPNLYRQATRYSWYGARKLLGMSPQKVALPEMRRHVYVIFLLYALLCNLFLMFALWASYHYLGATISRLPRLYPALFSSVMSAVASQDVILFLNRAVALFFAIAFPGTALIGLYKYTSLIVGHCLARIQAYRLSSHA
jgi:putative peptide zinc metalloprotease protein